ncbi:GGDEF domain-containing protein, partial [Rhizobium hidalgonense]
IGGFILIEVLLSQWRQREKKIELLSQIDPLTGLYNRRTLYGFLLNLIGKKYSKPALHSLILLDLDFFKKINDSCGHVMGDKVLVEASRVLKSMVREKDIVGRFGGEEFIIILANTSYKQTSLVAERCRKELNNLVLHDDHQNKLVVTASFGVTHFDATTRDIDSILKEADQALYHAKDSGRNQVCHYWDYKEQNV